MIIKRALPAVRNFSILNKSVTRLPMCVRSSSYDHPPPDYVYPTYDHVPVPCGDWNEHYCNNQRKYNLHLLLGSGFFLITCIVCYYSGAFWCNLFPPEKPGPRSERKCD